jgi:hypothetical protein
VRTWILTRYDLNAGTVSFEGAYLSPEAAVSVAREHGADGRWLDSGGGTLFAAEKILYGREVTWYLCQAEMAPAFSWEAARAVSRFLRAILTGIMKNGIRS